MDEFNTPKLILLGAPMIPLIIWFILAWRA